MYTPTEDDLYHKIPGIKLYKSQVWGKFDENHHNIDRGMIVARSLPKVDEYFSKEEHTRITNQIPDVCPIWKDKLQYKSVTAICSEEEFDDVTFWLEYVHGGGYEKVKKLPDGKVAIRSYYQAW